MRILQIQGLRALAALLVTIFHARLLPGGFIGVDIFYVISGYLITGLILREIENTGRLDLQTFYQRRIKRLLPTSVFVLFVTAIVGMFVLPVITRDALGRDLFAAAAYISNYLFAWWENDYQNLDATPSPFIHYWSLAVEEQFYVIWPIFLHLSLSLREARNFPWNRHNNISFPYFSRSTKHRLLLSGLFTPCLLELGNLVSALYFCLFQIISGKIDSFRGLA